MKAFLLRIGLLVLALCPLASAQLPTYTNFIRQVQFPTGVQYDAPVTPTGAQQSALEINPGGARFELWTLKSSPLTSYLLDTKYVGAYVPISLIQIRSEDPYTAIPRTRADRPFFVDLNVSGLLNAASDPVASKSVTLLRHVQSYGTAGTGIGIDRTQASLISQASIVTNGSQVLTYVVNSIPGVNRSKVRGEERFSSFSVVDYQAPASQLASQYIQVWPVADGSISGISNGQLVRFQIPTLTLTINDIYPDARVYAQVYTGSARLGVSGAIIPGSALIINDTVPSSRVLTLSKYDSVFTQDGQWTLELLTSTPFGIDRLAYVTFTLNRSIKINGSVTTIN
jgi:hypothetical protein